jgi:5-methylthioribose kinase
MAPPKFEEVYSPERGCDPATAGQSRSADPYRLPNMIIDIESSDQLLGYLRATKRIGSHEKPIVRTLKGGVSNKTVWLQRELGPAWVVKQALAKLRVKSDWFSDPLRIRIEADALRFLPSITPPGTITPLVFEDREQNILAMEAVPPPHENWKERLLSGKIDLALIQEFGELLGRIHQRSYLRSDELRAKFSDRTFFHTLRLEPYYEYSSAVMPSAKPFLTELVADTLNRQETFVHGDFSPKNILIYQHKPILLDHEVAHFGDPAFDLGFSLTHLLSKAHHLPSNRLILFDAALRYWDTYFGLVRESPWTTGLEHRAVKHTSACLLARAVGRSPLEYLNDSERSAQTQAALDLIEAAPATLSELVEIFARRIMS